MKRALVPGDSPILRSGTPMFDFTAPPCDPAALSVDMTDTMLGEAGLGLSAVQIGYPFRAFVMKTTPIIAVFNPRLLDASEETETLDEACLSFPGLNVPIKRAQRIRVRYQQPNAETVTKSFAGMTARCFLHELDHCDGILFYNRGTRFHRDRAFSRQKIWLRRVTQHQRQEAKDRMSKREFCLENGIDLPAAA